MPLDAQISMSRDFARALDPVLLARDCGIDPDPMQADLLTSTSRKVLVNCCRQWGKSTTTGIVALHEALYAAPAMIILVSPSQSQSTELFKKIAGFRDRLPGAPEVNQESLTRMELDNGSRILSLPGSEKTVRGYSGATLVVVDEASRVSDELLAAVRPMLATTNGRFIGMTTPRGRRGWFFDAWTSDDDTWKRIEVKGEDCPRISAEFLAEEMKQLGPMRFAEEYCCEFIDNETSVFRSDLIEAALVNDFEKFL
jgi:hypothetical protein